MKEEMNERIKNERINESKHTWKKGEKNERVNKRKDEYMKR